MSTVPRECDACRGEPPPGERCKLCGRTSPPSVPPLAELRDLREMLEAQKNAVAYAHQLYITEITRLELTLAQMEEAVRRLKR